MKNFYLLSMLLITYSISFAQITVTNKDFIPLNSTLEIATDTMPDASIDPGPAGANQTWDFSNVVAHKVDTLHTVSPAKTPFANFFPESNYAGFKSDDSVYIYFHRNDDKVKLLGVGFDKADAYIPFVKTTPPEILLDFPANYGDDYTQTFYSDVSIVNPDPDLGYDSVRFKKTTVSHTVIDAYGSLTTPLGTFDVLRMKDYDMKYDTIWAMLFGNWIAVSAKVDSSVSYNWWTNDVSVGFILFSIDVDLKTNEIESVRYLKNSVAGVGEHSFKPAKVYPNPSSGVINIEFEKDISGQITVYNQAGQMVDATVISKQRSSQLSVLHFVSGMYIYKVTNNKGDILYQGKFIKK